MTEIRERDDGAPADAHEVLDDDARIARRLQRLREDDIVEAIVGIVDEVDVGVAIEKSVTLDRAGRPFSLDPRGSLANLLAEQGLFMLSRSKG